MNDGNKFAFRNGGGRLRQRGFSLLEVLVALAVLSVGLLGLAGLQTISMKFNHQSYERTQATLLIDNIIDRMRANPQGVAAGAYNAYPFGSAIPSAPNCSTTACVAAQLASFDISQWKTAIMAPGMLAGGDGQIIGDGSVFTITVRWVENDLQMNQAMTVQIL